MSFPIYYMLLVTARTDNDHLLKQTILKNKLYMKKHWRSLSEEGRKNSENGQWGKKMDVRWMEKEFTDKNKGLKSLALLATGKKWHNKWWMHWNVVNSMMDELLLKI